MKKFAVMLSLVVGVWVLSPTPQAHASWWGDFVSYFTGGHSDNGNHKASKYKKFKKHKKAKNHKAAVPELDPSAAGGAIVLMLGGVAYLASRRREEALV